MEQKQEKVHKYYSSRGFIVTTDYRKKILSLEKIKLIQTHLKSTSSFHALVLPYFSVTGTKRQDNVGAVNSIPERELLTPRLGKLFIKCKGKRKSKQNWYVA